MRETAISLILFAAVMIAAVAGQAARAAEAPRDVIEKISLTHTDPNDLVRVLTIDSLENPTPKASPDFAAISLVPKGISGLLGYPLDRSLLIQGSPAAISTLKAIVGVADVAREKLPDGQMRVALQPERAKIGALLDAVRALPAAGKSTVDEKRLVLEGKPEWIHRALRTAIRMELNALNPPVKEQQ